MKTLTLRRERPIRTSFGTRSRDVGLHEFLKQAVLSSQRLVEGLKSLQNFAGRPLFGEPALETYGVAGLRVVENQDVPHDCMVVLVGLEFLACLDESRPRVLPLLYRSHTTNLHRARVAVPRDFCSVA